jgi:predicted DCC family thiol-disulfide oxidoreductase YuxK
MLSVPPNTPSSSFGSFRGSVRLISHCPLCHAFYQPTAARVLAEHDDTHLIHLECTACGGAIIAVIVANLVGVQSMGLVTDLTPEDILRLRSAAPVSPDNILDLHHFLEQDQSLLNL